MRQRGYPLIAVLLLLGGVWWWLTATDRRPAPEDLANQALHAPSLGERVRSAAQLANYGPLALESLRHVAHEAKDPEVTSVCLQGLAKLWDYDSMDLLLELAESGSPSVRGQAAQVVMRMTGRHRPYLSSAPPAERQLLVSHMRDDWAAIQGASREDREELKRRLRASHE